MAAGAVGTSGRPLLCGIGRHGHSEYVRSPLYVPACLLDRVSEETKKAGRTKADVATRWAELMLDEPTAAGNSFVR